MAEADFNAFSTDDAANIFACLENSNNFIAEILREIRRASSIDEVRDQLRTICAQTAYQAELCAKMQLPPDTPSVPPPTTVQTDFFGASGNEIFSVRAGCDIQSAIETARNLLGSALPLAMDTAEVANTEESWAPVYLLRMAKAAVESVFNALDVAAIEARNRDKATA